MINCFFVSDLHGNTERYEKLFNEIKNENPELVFLGGDLFPSGKFHFTSSKNLPKEFINNFLITRLLKLKSELKEKYPKLFVILGNDDAKAEEQQIMQAEELGVWEYIHFKVSEYKNYKIFGYSYTVPSPFKLKDWEKYDVSRYVDPGCISPEEGFRTIEISDSEKKLSTIAKDLEILTDNHNLESSIFLMHSPPYRTNLDRAALDGKMVDYAPLDVHIGSVAIKKFIIKKQPLLTMHGHVHESARITGSWKDKIGRTYCFSAAHDGKELALIKFDLEKLSTAERILL
ncbi:metallophosphoesterase [Melioribacteraceae bacterium 4301-Me]|uniref:metallophosphoesterase family protein n=1 Tax=Pyranulibacter aquaticus TaxID=3163344 RepID=UPI00359634B7